MSSATACVLGYGGVREPLARYAKISAGTCHFAINNLSLLSTSPHHSHLYPPTTSSLHQVTSEITDKVRQGRFLFQALYLLVSARFDGLCADNARPRLSVSSRLFTASADIVSIGTNEVVRELYNSQGLFKSPCLLSSSISKHLSLLCTSSCRCLSPPLPLHSLRLLPPSPQSTLSTPIPLPVSLYFPFSNP